ncbi:MAG: ATP-binding protein [Candidatus Acidiferrales bacterium]
MKLGLRNSRISTDLTLLNLLVSSAALLIACSAFVGYDQIAFRKSMLSELSIQAQIIGSNSISALLFNDPSSAKTTLSALDAAPHVVSAGIYSSGGRRFASYQRAGTTTMPSLPTIREGATESYHFGGGDVVLARSIIFHKKLLGTVYLDSDLKETDLRLKEYAGIALAILVASLGAALIVSSIFRKAVADPIVRLAALAREVTQNGNYSARAQPTRRRDEVASLIDALNEMLEQIQKRDVALQDAHDELERRVEERTAQLTHANKELESFSYSVSHDLRAPLRSIDGFSQALLEDCEPQLDEAGKDYLRRIRGSAQRMGLLIDDLLNLARVSRAKIQKQKVDLTALAASIVNDLRRTQLGRDVEIRIEEGVEVWADPGLLRIVLENLLNNAWKFTSKRDRASIEFGYIRDNGKSSYFVRDNGAGFDPKYADRLFGAFQRLHAMNDFPGTGVGLATVQRIISRHGGAVWAESAVDQGASFYFTL